MAEFIYHYTSLDTLLGVLRSGVLWATDIVYLNDFKEFIYAAELAAEIIPRCPTGKREALEFGLQGFDQGPTSVGDSSIYVACFSEAPDLLSQWRAYCPPQGGVSIGLGFTALSDVVVPHGFRLVKCVYSREEQLELVRRFLEQACAFATDAETIDFCQSRFGYLAPVLKHPAFEEEQEWRLISPPVDNADPRVRYRPGRSMLVPYIEVPIASDGPLAIRRLWLGPTPHPNEAWFSAARMWSSFAKLGRLVATEYIPLQVLNSEIPYRNW